MQFFVSPLGEWSQLDPSRNPRPHEHPAPAPQSETSENRKRSELEWKSSYQVNDSAFDKLESILFSIIPHESRVRFPTIIPAAHLLPPCVPVHGQEKGTDHFHEVSDDFDVHEVVRMRCFCHENASVPGP